jgi:hypothetical protein
MKSRKNFRHLLSAVCCLLSAHGCAYAPLRGDPPTPQPLPQETAAYYAYPHAPTNVTTEPLRENRWVRESLIRFPLSASGFEPTEPVVECEWFESSQPGRRPAILFNPILGGDYPLERKICRFLARHGFHVALVHRKTLKIGPDQPVEHLELLLRQGIVRIRQIVDWMEAHERVEPSQMGGFGISMGGIASVITAAVEPRLRAHVVALAGGGIPDILITSRDSLLTKPLARYLAHHHMDLRTMEALLRQHIKTDPVRLAPHVDSTRLLMFIALGDRTIGRANALRLRRALGSPATVFLPTGHYTAYFMLPYVQHASLKFFRRHLAAPPPPT